MTDDRVELSLPEIEHRVRELIAAETGIRERRIEPQMSLLQDLGIDSLAIIALVMEIEETFDITIPDEPDDPVTKRVFTRSPFRVCDLAELVFLRAQAGRTERARWTSKPGPRGEYSTVVFTQLGGRLPEEVRLVRPLYEGVGDSRAVRLVFRRVTDGMQCVLLPGVTTTIGASGPGCEPDEGPPHEVSLDPFLIDVEPVSTTAYCRFLNSIGDVDSETLRRWFVLDPEDRRSRHMPIVEGEEGWAPVAAAERWPMMLVSWYGATAYSLWANGGDWRTYESDARFLPSEAQWEYAARGAEPRRFPWGDGDPTPELARLACHRWRRSYELGELPLAAVNEQAGLSPFGLRHMAGNVWSWCRDDYDPGFYSTEEARGSNAACQSATGVKSERGGSWVGPAELARCSYRRGRPPLARGRCLGFRCVRDAAGLWF